MPVSARSSRLKTYASKRNFASTPEPKPDSKPGRNQGRSKAGGALRTQKKQQLRFCIQKHLASSLHYDLRLEHAGVLLSWAVPKGPSLNPSDKRMAVRTEDHPLAYADFEGVIPEGYGAGIVLLWDQGTWQCEQDDVDAAMKEGELKFRLEGVKLKGSWVLVRTRRKAETGPEQWLLIKHRDHWSGDVNVTEAAPDSIKSFGDLPDVLAASEHPNAFDVHRPAKGGEAGRLMAQTVAAAKATSSEKTVPNPTKRRPRVALKPLPKSSLSTSRHTPKLTNQQKVLYPQTAFTKGDLVDYYRRVAPLILPHLRGRAVTLKRYPDGVEGKSFFEKRCAAHRPDWVKTVSVASRHAGAIGYCLIEDVSTLMWTANLAAIELHVPLALADDPETPTAMVFDLDPGPPADLADACRVGVRLRDLLAQAGLQSFAKTSGSKGLHLLVPLNTPGVTFDQTKDFAKAVAMTLQKDDPKGVIAMMNRSAREGKVFIDWSQNDRAKTTVCVYSARARPRPTISTPVSWKQVEPGKPKSMEATAALPRHDEMIEVLTLRQSLPRL